jgi:DNA-binding CsgD family transcriptional regulator
MSPDPRASSPLHGLDFEEFISQLCVVCIGLGRADRSSLRERGYSDDQIDLGTAELLARGFLVRTEDDDAWGVVPPRQSFPRYLEVVEHRAALARAALPELDNQWRRAVGRGTLAAVPDLDVLSSVPEVTERIVQMHRTARTRLWWAFDASVATRELLTRATEDPGLLALADGVDVRLVLDTALLAEPWALDRLARADAQGHAARVGNGVPFGIVVCDDESVLVEISSHDPNGYGSLALRREPARQAVTRLFGQIWALSTPFGPTRKRLEATGEEPVAPLDARDTKVLALLAVGASDKVIARQVGASVRTVERRVRYLMEHLGAATRFQAGVQAVRRGWV